MNECHLLAALAEHLLPLSRAKQVSRRERVTRTRMNSVKSEMQKYRPQPGLPAVSEQEECDPFSTETEVGCGRGRSQSHLLGSEE